MIGKIIALVIAMLFLVAAPVYGSIANPAAPVNFGAGEGEGEVIATVDDLKAVLASVPALDDYLNNASMLDVYENFKSFTMVEDGYGKVENKSTGYLDTDGDGYGDQYTHTRVTNTRSHVLEICFALEGLYYNVVGEMEVLTEHYEDYSYESNSYNNMIFMERALTSYDIEIFYSDDEVLLKYNNYQTLNFTRDDYSDSWALEEIDVDELDSDELIAYKSLEMLEDVYGKWMKVEAPDLGIDLENPDTYPDTENMTEEEQEEYFMNMMVAEFSQVFSTTFVDQITQTTEQNCAYLRNLSNFITGSITTAFNNVGSDYNLKSGEDYIYAYISGILGAATANQFDMDLSDADCFFNVNSSEVVLTQFADLRPTSGINRNVIYTVTTFKNLGNTVAAVKDVEIDTVYNVFYEPLKEMLEELYKSDEEGVN